MSIEDVVVVKNAGPGPDRREPTAEQASERGYAFTVAELAMAGLGPMFRAPGLSSEPDHGVVAARAIAEEMQKAHPIDKAKAGGSQRVRAVVDAGTCTTCRTADGTIADAMPACEHVASGTGNCRCVLAKAGG